MKTMISAVCAVLVLATGVAGAGEKPTKAEAAAKEKKDSKEFARMKTLVGSWTGKTDMGQGPIDVTIKYRLLAGGSVLEERIFEGTPHEMVTMYYDQGDKLAGTHYCVIGNRPGMLLKSSNEKSITLAFDATCGLNPKKESFMHGLTITFNDADTITTSCKAVMEGKEQPEHATTLKRSKA